MTNSPRSARARNARKAATKTYLNSVHDFSPFVAADATEHPGVANAAVHSDPTQPLVHVADRDATFALLVPVPECLGGKAYSAEAWNKAASDGSQFEVKNGILQLDGSPVPVRDITPKAGIDTTKLMAKNADAPNVAMGLGAAALRRLAEYAEKANVETIWLGITTTADENGEVDVQPGVRLMMTNGNGDRIHGVMSGMLADDTKDRREIQRMIVDSCRLSDTDASNVGVKAPVTETPEPAAPAKPAAPVTPAKALPSDTNTVLSTFKQVRNELGDVEFTSKAIVMTMNGESATVNASANNRKALRRAWKEITRFKPVAAKRALGSLSSDVLDAFAKLVWQSE